MSIFVKLAILTKMNLKDNIMNQFIKQNLAAKNEKIPDKILGKSKLCLL